MTWPLSDSVVIRSRRNGPYLTLTGTLDLGNGNILLLEKTMSDQQIACSVIGLESAVEDEIRYELAKSAMEAQR